MASPNVEPGYTASAALTQKGWDNKLLAESATGDVFSQNSGIYNENTKQVPDSIVMHVKGKEKSRSLPMLNRLSGAGQIGNKDLRGAEEVQATRDLTLYANEWFHGVPIEQYGLKKISQDPYKVYSQAQPQLSTWASEIRGKKIREALCEMVDGGQAASTASGGLNLDTVINPNFLVGGASAPVTFDEDQSTYSTAIQSSVSGSTTAKLSVGILNQILEYASTVWQIEPVVIGGKARYIVTVPTRQKTALITPGSNTFFEMLKDADVRGSNNRAISHVLGEYQNLLLVEDMRAPVVTISSNVVTFAYKGAGSADGRNLAGHATRFDVLGVFGKGSIIDYEVEALHFEEEVQNYNRNWGIGAFTTQGYTRADYTGTGGRRNQSSAIVTLKTA